MRFVVSETSEGASEGRSRDGRFEVRAQDLGFAAPSHCTLTNLAQAIALRGSGHS